MRHEECHFSGLSHRRTEGRRGENGSVTNRLFNYGQNGVKLPPNDKLLL